MDALRALIQALPETAGYASWALAAARLWTWRRRPRYASQTLSPHRRIRDTAWIWRKAADIWVLPALTGTGAEITPIAVLRGPEKKLGINNKYTEASVAVIDPALTRHAPAFNRFYTMMDCYFHHYEIMTSKTSAPEGIEDAKLGFALAKEVLSRDLSEYNEENAVKSAIASVLAAAAPYLAASVRRTRSHTASATARRICRTASRYDSMCALEDVYPDGYGDTMSFLAANDAASRRPPITV